MEIRNKQKNKNHETMTNACKEEVPSSSLRQIVLEPLERVAVSRMHRHNKFHESGFSKNIIAIFLQNLTFEQGIFSLSMSTFQDMTTKNKS